jgi:hypothetical protein
LDDDDVDESGDSEDDDKDLEVLRHALDESRRSGDGTGSSSGGCVACTTDEDRATRKHSTSLCSRGRVQSVLVPPVTVVKAFRP